MQVFQSAVYLLCLTTCLVCTYLLARSYWKSRAKLLFWSTLCFIGLAVSNFLLFFDVVIFPVTISLLPLRHLSALVAVGVLLYGFIWEAD